MKQSDIVCIAMGDLIKRKNYETSIRSIALLNNKNVHFLICGDGPEKKRLEALARELKLMNTKKKRYQMILKSY